MLSDLQERMVDALYGENPAEDLQKIIKDFEDDPAELTTVQDDGWHLSHLLLMKLRFERLTRGNPALMEEFEQNPAAFTERFKEYHNAVKPNVFFPAEEAELYQEWLNQ